MRNLFKIITLTTVILVSGCVTQQEVYTEKGSEAQYKFRPDIPNFYSSIEDVAGKITTRCRNMTIRDLDFLLDVARKSQRQIDCEGFEYRGKDRFMELMFSDDELDLVIVLIEQEEYEALSQKFKETYGQPTHDSEIGQFYYYDAVAIRTRPYEVVFTSKRTRANYQVYMDYMARQETDRNQ